MVPTHQHPAFLSGWGAIQCLTCVRNQNSIQLGFHAEVEILKNRWTVETGKMCIMRIIYLSICKFLVDLIYYSDERFKRLVHEWESLGDLHLMDLAMCRWCSLMTYLCHPRHWSRCNKSISCLELCASPAQTPHMVEESLTCRIWLVLVFPREPVVAYCIVFFVSFWNQSRYNLYMIQILRLGKFLLLFAVLL